MINLETDKLRPLSYVIRDRIGKRTSPATLWRWRLKGVNGVRLECVRVGGYRSQSNSVTVGLTVSHFEPPSLVRSRRANVHTPFANQASPATVFPLASDRSSGRSRPSDGRAGSPSAPSPTDGRRRSQTRCRRLSQRLPPGCQSASRPCAPPGMIRDLITSRAIYLLE